jgi:hypothetical protein
MPDSDPIKDHVSALDDDEVRAAQVPLEPLLDAQRTRIEYTETRRAALGVLGGVILAAGLAGLIQLADGSVIYEPVEAGLIALTASLALTGVSVLVLYGRQTTWKYPFKDDQASTWKWFYRDAIPEANSVVPNWHGHQNEDFIHRSQQAFQASRAPYAERMTSLADAKVNLTQDLEQAHLLNWNEFYKNRFLEHLRFVLIRGVVASVVIGAVAFVVALLIRACG